MRGQDRQTRPVRSSHLSLRAPPWKKTAPTARPGGNVRTGPEMASPSGRVVMCSLLGLTNRQLVHQLRLHALIIKNGHCARGRDAHGTDQRGSATIPHQLTHLEHLPKPLRQYRHQRCRPAHRRPARKMEKRSRAETPGAYGTDQGPINSRRATRMQPLQCRSTKRSRKYTMLAR